MPSPFSCIENDYVINNKKCCGNAQYIKKDRWLHHSSFLWDYKDENMIYLKTPKKAPAYRQNRKHRDFLHPINNHFASKEAFTKKIEENLKPRFTIAPISLENTKRKLSTNYNRSTKIIDL